MLYVELHFEQVSIRKFDSVFQILLALRFLKFNGFWNFSVAFIEFLIIIIN